MKLKMFEKEINLELFYQFKEMIMSLSEEDYDAALVNSTVLGFEKPVVPLPTMYNLKYPGEVLERYKEKGLDDIKSMRALMLALTECIPAIQPRMFVDQQLPNFMEEVKQKAHNDLYLICALLKWENDTDKKLELCAKFSATATASDAAWLYSIALIKDLPTGWEMVEERLAYIFMFHSIDVYENTDVIAWMQRELPFEIQRSRKTCTKILKIFMELPKHWLKWDSVDFKYLKSLNYTEQEIIYIAMYTSKCWELTKNVQGYRAIQKILVNGCSYYLSARVIENKDIIDMCVTCLNKLRQLLQRVEGADRLRDAIGDIVIGTYEMFDAVWNNVESSNKSPEWFYVDILEPEWDDLLDIVGPKEYRNIAEYAMYNHVEQIQDYILRYNDVCNTEYRKDILFEKTSLSLSNVEILQNAGVIDIYSLIDICVEKTEGASYTVHSYVKKYLSSNIQDKIECWKWVVSKYNVETLSKITGVNGFVSESIGVRNNYNSNRNIKFNNFSDEDKLLLFDWITQELYTLRPDSYISTLADLFINVDMSFISKESISRICESLSNTDSLSQMVKLELVKVCSPEKYEEVKQAYEEEKVQHALEKEKQQLEEWHKQVIEMVTAEGDPAQAMIDAFNDYKKWQKGYSQVCLDIFMSKKDELLFTEDNVGDICEALLSLVSNSKVDNFTFTDYKNIINSLGVTE